MLEGLDISNNNSGVDLAREKDARGLSFVILKVTEGTYFVDADYADWRQQARDLGLIWGAYHFARPAQNVHAEADFFLNHAQPVPGEIIALDLEDTGGLSWAAVAEWAQEWFAQVDPAIGRHADLYVNRNYLRSMPTSNLTAQGLWAAEPGTMVNGQLAPSYTDRWSTWAFHQYGIAAGYPGGPALDQNHFNGDMVTLWAHCGLVPPAPNGRTWTVKYLPAGTPTPAPWSAVVTITVQAPDSDSAERMIPAGAILVGVFDPS